MKNDRLQALRILLKLLQEKIPLSHLMAANKDLSPFSKDLCFGVCRHYFRLHAIMDSLIKKRPKQMEIRIALCMGFYQLHYMQKPDYAVVKETVALLDQLKMSGAKGLINAVLRTFCRERDSLLAKLQQQDDFIYGHPQWFIEKLKQDWPSDWQTILQANDQHPPMSLRVNQRHGKRETYLARLQEEGIAASAHTDSDVGILLAKACDVSELPGFYQGDVSVQDEAAQLAVSLLTLKPGLRVLDACCAPGGKTSHILETEPQLGECVAIDVDARRLQRVHENLQRLNLQATLLQGDGLTPQAWWDGQLFDRILLDAPCSATGVIRRHPDIKLLRTQADIDEISITQQKLLQALWPLLAPHGILVYATCSITKQENEQQIAQFIAANSDCHLINTPQNWGKSAGFGWQIFPGENNKDGFFYSVLCKG